ncbi:MAG: PIN domain-containing protein [Elusimicrobiota bacterium]
MILVDTSIWIDHLRRGDSALAARLSGGEVLTHPLIIEELACGRLLHRIEILGLLEELPTAPVASHTEVLGLISGEGLGGSGIGAVDAHLLASARLANVMIWSRDKALARAAKRLGIAQQ